MTAVTAWLEYRVTARRPWALRVYADGRVEEYSDERLEFIDGDFKPMAMPLEWRATTRLTSSETERLQNLVREVGFFQLPERAASDDRVSDGAVIEWLVELDGRRHQVRARGPEAGRLSELETLRLALEQMTAEAYQRDAAGSESTAL